MEEDILYGLFPDKVVTDTRKVLDARPGRAWQTVNWSDELEIMGHSFTIENIIKEQD